MSDEKKQFAEGFARRVVAKLMPSEQKKMIVLQKVRRKHGKQGLLSADELGLTVKRIESGTFNKNSF